LSVSGGGDTIREALAAERHMNVKTTGDILSQPDVFPESAVTVSGLWKTYGQDAEPVRALRGVDLTVNAGEFVSVIGPSGSGKSTLLALIAGLDRPSDGRVVVAGMDLTRMTDDEMARMRRRHVGVVFQAFHLLEGMSVLDNIMMALVIAGHPKRAALQRAQDLVDLLGLGQRAHDTPGRLSGGQRQRLAIARAIANQPTLLLADEPTGALDSAGSREVLELFRRLHAEGQTTLIVTHDEKVAQAAQRRVLLRDGRVDGQPDPWGAGHPAP
jgi:putative ABC transport system ATP-binding protein